MSYNVRISTTDETFEVNDGESILDAAMRVGVPMAHECTFGGCATCRVKLDEGAVEYEEFPMALTQEEHELGYALACQARPKENLVVTPARGAVLLPDSVQAEAEVLEKTPLTDEVVYLSLKIDDEIDVDFLPGQHLHINYPARAERSFSMVSAFAFGNMVDLYVKRIPNGWFTNVVLDKLQPGDKLELSLPHGEFYYRADDWRPMVFIATGTGIAPVRSVLESLLDDEDCPPVSLYWGMRTEKDLFLQEELESWADRLCEFRYEPVLSRPSEQWKGRRGYVQEVLKEDITDVSELAFYLCGSPEMISDVRKLLIQQGADPDYIYSDSFTYAAIEEGAAQKKPTLGAA